MDTPNPPRLEIQRIHIRGLKSIQALNLPEDGFGWGDRFPPVAMIAGANGSGKTTLLRCIVEAIDSFRGSDFFVTERKSRRAASMAQELLVRFVLENTGKIAQLSCIVGPQLFVKDNLQAGSRGLQRMESYNQIIEENIPTWVKNQTEGNIEGSLPRVVFFPSDYRDLVTSEAPSKTPGLLEDRAGFVAVWKRPEPGAWSGTVEELLFSARWADLNAMAQGEPSQEFERYTRAFADLTDGQKKLGWTPRGELVVRLKDGTTHGIGALSSGERQALLLLAELRRLWRPGSLILIDELELHLHDVWQARLYAILQDMQRELGGQVILTTQSHTLFQLAAPGSRVVLDRRPLEPR